MSNSDCPSPHSWGTETALSVDSNSVPLFRHSVKLAVSTGEGATGGAFHLSDRHQKRPVEYREEKHDFGSCEHSVPVSLGQKNAELLYLIRTEVWL